MVERIGEQQVADQHMELRAMRLQGKVTARVAACGTSRPCWHKRRTHLWGSAVVMARYSAISPAGVEVPCAFT